MNRHDAQIFGIAIASRALLAAVAATIPLPHMSSPIAALSGWDAAFYLGIAARGYTAQTSFFPGFPLLVRAFVLLGVPVGVAALMISNLLFVAGVWIAARWAARRRGPAAGFNLAIILSFFPTSVFFSAAYAESLFLVLSALAFLALQDRPWAAALAAAGAAAVRPTGMFLSLAVAVGGPPRTTRQRMAQGAVSLAGLAAWCAWNGIVFHRPFGWLAVEARSGRFQQMTSVTGWILYPLWQITQRSTYGLAGPWGTFFDPLLAALALIALPPLARTRRWPDLMYVLPSVVAPLASGAVGHRSAGFGRYALVLFPLMALGSDGIGDVPWRRAVVTAILILGDSWCATLFFRGQFLG